MAKIDKENCSEVKKLEEFLTVLSVLRVANEEEILREYECLKPCNYIEYRVTFRRKTYLLICVNVFLPDNRRTYGIDP